MKNKFLLMGLIGLTTISLAGVGFATWVVGVQKKEMDTKLKVDVDDTQNDSIIVQATMATEKLIVAQNTEVVREKGDIIGTSKSKDSIGYDANALKFTLTNITYMVGKAATGKPTKLHIELDNTKNTFNQTKTEYVQNKVKPAKTYKRDALGTDESWTYLSFSTDILLSDMGEDQNKTDTTAKYEKYVIESREFTIGWGTYFDSKLPTTFYNDKYEAEEDADFLFSSGEYVTKELQEMKNAFASKTVTISLSLK